MSLDYYLDTIPNYENVCWIEEPDGYKHLDSVCEALTWGTMYTSISTITEKNIDEWLWRFQFFKQIERSFWNKLDDDGKPVAWYPDRADLTKFIGLRTNADNMTRKQFIKRVVDGIVSDTDYRATREKSDAVL